jgi:radical SAM protein with 4Fe4S-binding SPASM domain
MTGLDLSKAPHVLTWELTRACGLKCRHCRANAIPKRNPRELTLAEVKEVIRDIATNFEVPPLMVFTGGDPVERVDLDDILRASVEAGLHTAVSPSVTPLLTRKVLERWVKIGVKTISISIDGPSSEVHDRFRRVEGTFAASVERARDAKAAGLSLQVNTSLCGDTFPGLHEMGELVKELGVSSWEIFFVVPTGRGAVLPKITATQTEEALKWMATFAQTVKFRVTAIAAPQFRRVILENVPGAKWPTMPAIREAQGFVFIDHVGEVNPSGYLPIAAGNVRARPLSEIYRESPIFKELRDPEALKDRCGRCEYKRICGGSRARAYAVTGDMQAEDPACPHVPELNGNIASPVRAAA